MKELELKRREYKQQLDESTKTHEQQLNKIKDLEKQLENIQHTYELKLKEYTQRHEKQPNTIKYLEEQNEWVNTKLELYEEEEEEEEEEERSWSVFDLVVAATVASFEYFVNQFGPNN